MKGVKQLSCEEVRRLHDFNEKNPPQEQIRAMARHLQSCRDCRTVLSPVQSFSPKRPTTSLSRPTVS